MLFETRSEQISDNIDNMRKQPQFSLKRDTSLTTNSLEKSVANSTYSTYSTGSSKLRLLAVKYVLRTYFTASMK